MQYFQPYLRCTESEVASHRIPWRFPCTLKLETGWSRKGCSRKLLPLYIWPFWTDILDVAGEVGLILCHPGIYIYRAHRGYFTANFLLQIGTGTCSTQGCPLGYFMCLRFAPRRKLQTGFPSASLLPVWALCSGDRFLIQETSISARGLFKEVCVPKD